MRVLAKMIAIELSRLSRACFGEFVDPVDSIRVAEEEPNPNHHTAVGFEALSELNLNKT
jgi:hypothetical protein